MSRKPLLIALVVVALAALGVAAWYEFSSPSASTDAVPDAAAQGVIVTAWDKTLGNPKAPVLMVEYAAPTCPHCAHFDQEDFPIQRLFPLDRHHAAVRRAFLEAEARQEIGHHTRY